MLYRGARRLAALAHAKGPLTTVFLYKVSTPNNLQENHLDNDFIGAL